MHSDFFSVLRRSGKACADGGDGGPRAGRLEGAAPSAEGRSRSDRTPGREAGGSASRAAEPARPPRSGSEASDDSGARCGRGGRRPAPVALGRVSPAWAGPGRAEGSDVPPASPVGVGPAGAGRSVRAPWAGAWPGCESCLHEVLAAQVRLRCWAPRWAWPASGGGAGWKGPDANCPDQLRGWATVPKSRRWRPPGAGRPVPYGSLNQGPRRDRAHCASTPRQPVRQTDGPSSPRPIGSGPTALNALGPASGHTRRATSLRASLRSRADPV